MQYSSTALQTTSSKIQPKDVSAVMMAGFIVLDCISFIYKLSV